MEGGQIRQRTTLLDQLSVLPSPNLADLLKVRDSVATAASTAGRRETVTLATVLASDSPIPNSTISIAAALASDATAAESTNSTSTSAAAAGGRTLLDIISEEEESRGAGAGYGGWRALKERLRIRRDGGRPEATIRVSLMTLLELREREEEEEGSTAVGVMAVGEEEESDGIAGGKAGRSQVCCVCMEREKGAAFIPCGHTFCRVCSRELWLGRGNCPLCNGAISEVLDIFC